MVYPSIQKMKVVLQFYYENYTDEYGHQYNELALTSIYNREGIINLFEKYSIDYNTIYEDMNETIKRRQMKQSQKENEIPYHFMTEFMSMSQKLDIEYSCPCCLDKIKISTIHLPKCCHMICKGCYHKLSTKLCPTCRCTI